MSYSPKYKGSHGHLIQQPSFKHSLMAALVITLGGTSLATWAGDNVTAASATPAPVATNPAYMADHREQWKQNRIQRRTEAFQQADTNKDGKVTLTEWQAFKPHHHGFWHHLCQRMTGHGHHPHQDQRSDLHNKVETNGDGHTRLS